MSYIYGVDDVNESLDTNIKPKNIDESVFRKIDGKTWQDRIRDAETFSDLERIAKTESHRDFSEGQYQAAVEGGATHKEWVTMGDDKVRESHWYIDGLKVPIDENFYTLDGDYAPHPFGFMSAENNINCRCTLKYTKE